MILRAFSFRLLHRALFIALLCTTARVWAQPEAVANEELAGDESPAATLFREGRALLVAGQFAEACAKLDESWRLEPRVGTQLNVAFCQERLGKVATAWTTFRNARERARVEGDAARTEFATKWITVLEPRLSWLELQVPDGIDANEIAVFVDGESLMPSRWHADQPLDSGEHLLVATHAGTEYWRSRVVLRESQHVAVAVPEPAPAVGVKAPVPPSARVEPKQSAHVTTERSQPETSTNHFVFHVGVFGGLMGIDTVESEPERDPDKIEFYETDDAGNTRRVSCGNSICTYGSPDGGWVLLGIKGFVGYTLTERSSIGIRSHVGVNLGGGTVVAAGPSFSLRLGQLFSVAPTLLLGAASHAGSADTQLESPSGNRFNYYGRVHATTQFAMGLGVDLEMDLVGSSTGALVLQCAPAFLSGANGLAWFVPLGAGYRWK